MGKHDRLSRDQKRKAKLKKRAERARKHESLAYAGKKYKTDEYAPFFFRTEVGIYESYVMCDRVLTDDQVEAAIERLVTLMRQGPLPPLSETGSVTLTEGDEEELVIANIRRNWQIMAEEGTLPGRDDLIGILRTILHSIEVWRSQSLHSQGYLRYVEGFLKKLGVSGRRVTPGRGGEQDGGGGVRRSSRVVAPRGQRGPGDRGLPAVAGRDRGHGHRPSPPGVRRSWPSGVEDRDGVRRDLRRRRGEGIAWRGTVPPQKWMNFSTKGLSRFAATPGLKLEVSFEVPPGDAATEAKREETKAALRELRLAEDLGP